MQEATQTAGRARRHARAARTTTGILVALLAVVGVVALGVTLVRHRAESPDAALRGDDEESQGALDKMLAKKDPAQRLAMVLKLIHDPSPGLRYSTVDALEKETSPQAITAVEEAFTDSSAHVRQRALEILPGMDSKRGLRLQLAALRDEDTWIREASIGKLSSGVGPLATGDAGKWAVPTLVKALDDPDQTVAIMAVLALAKRTGNPWKVHHAAPDAEKQAVIARWKHWWEGARAGWKTPEEYAAVSPIRPTRTDPAPDFDFPDVEGRPVRLADQKGRITLLNFYGTWCPPCQQEIPDLIKLDTTYRDRKVDVVGVALGEHKGTAGLKQWCATHNVAYRQALAASDTLEAYGHIEEVPISVLIDGQGRIRYRWDGERDYGTYSAAVERLLKE